jgi:RNA polymerase sigma factor (sigma-70 family)
MMATPRDQQELGELTARLGNDDGDALGDVIRLLGYPTERRIRSRLGAALSDGDYQDVMAIALGRLWLHRHRFDPARSNLATWFYVLARSIALDVLRRRKRGREVAVDNLDILPSPEHDAPGGEPSPMWRDMLVALDRVSPVNRRILLSGLTETELSLELGLKPGAIRVRRSRTMDQLRTALRDMGYAV